METKCQIFCVLLHDFQLIFLLPDNYTLDIESLDTEKWHLWRVICMCMHICCDLSSLCRAQIVTTRCYLYARHFLINLNCCLQCMHILYHVTQKSFLFCTTSVSLTPSFPYLSYSCSSANATRCDNLENINWDVILKNGTTWKWNTAILNILNMEILLKLIKSCSLGFSSRARLSSQKKVCKNILLMYRYRWQSKNILCISTCMHLICQMHTKKNFWHMIEVKFMSLYKA